MALSLEELKAKRDFLVKSLGLSHLQHGNKSLTYGRDEEKLKALAAVDAEIKALESPQARQFTVQTSRGLHE